MTVAGSRPRYTLGGFPDREFKRLGRLIRFVRALFWPTRLRSTTVVENAAAAYLGYAAIIAAPSSPKYSRRLLRLACADAIAINSSIARANQILNAILVSGTIALGGALIALLADFRDFSPSMLVVVLLCGVVQSILVLPSLVRQIGALSPGLRRALALWVTTFLVTSYFTGTQAVFMNWRSRQLSIPEMINIACSAFLIITVITIGLAALAVALINLTERRYFISHNADGTAIMELMWAAHRIETARGEPVTTEWMWTVVDAFQQAATAVERGIPRIVAVEDQHTKLQLQSQLRRVADAIRSLQVRILVERGPISDEKVVRDAFTIAHGLLFQDYSALPDVCSDESEARRLTANRAIRRKFLTMTRAIAVAVIPLALVAILNGLGFLPTPSLSGPLFTLATTWLIVQIIALIEPNYKDSLGGVQSIVGLLDTKRT